MFDKSKIKPDPDNLTGLLMITAQDVNIGIHFLTIVSQEREKFVELVRHLSQKVKNLDGEDLADLIKAAEDQDRNTRHTHDLEIWGIDLFSPTDINSYTRQQDVNIYPLGFVLNSQEYEDLRYKVTMGYFFLYNQQQADRDY